MAWSSTSTWSSFSANSCTTCSRVALSSSGGMRSAAMRATNERSLEVCCTSNSDAAAAPRSKYGSSGSVLALSDRMAASIATLNQTHSSGADGQLKRQLRRHVTAL